MATKASAQDPRKRQIDPLQIICNLLLAKISIFLVLLKMNTRVVLPQVAFRSK